MGLGFDVDNEVVNTRLAGVFFAFGGVAGGAQKWKIPSAAVCTAADGVEVEVVAPFCLKLVAERAFLSIRALFDALEPEEVDFRAGAGAGAGADAGAAVGCCGDRDREESRGF